MRSRTLSISKLAILVAISTILLFEAYAGGTITPGEARGEGTAGQSSSSGASQQVNDWMANQGSGSTTAPAGTQATTPDGQSVGLQGTVNVQSGNIASADYLSFNNVEMTGVKNFFQSGTDFLVSFVNLLTLGSLEIINGKNIEYKNGILKAEHADSLQDTEIYNGKEDDKIQIEHAELVTSNTTEISGIDDTGFLVTNLAVEIYPKNGTVLNITDAAGNQFTVEAIGNDSKIIISKTIPPTHSIKSALFKHTYGNITEAIIAVNTTKIEMGSNGIRCMEITPIATFYHVETITKEFGINFPYGEIHRLCLRKLENETFNHTDSLVDYVDKEISLKGIVRYLRSLPLGIPQYSFGLKFVYQGKQATTKVMMHFDEDMIYINNLLVNISNTTNELACITHNGYHHISEYSNGKRYDVVLKKPSPFYIKQYQANNIANKIWFNKSEMENTLIQINQKLKSRISVYPPTKQARKDFIEFMQQSYAERNLENEI